MARKKELIEMKGLRRSNLEFLIREIVVGAYAYRNRKIIKDIVIDGYEIRPIAEKYKISETRTKTIVRNFCNEVHSYLEKHPL